MLRLSFALALILSASTALGATAQEMHSQAVRSVTMEVSAQKEYDAWTDRREAMAADLRDMKVMDSWLEFQNRKYEKYIQKQQEVIAELQRRKEEAKRIRMELEPLLDSLVDDLAAFVDADLPFLAAERRQRIDFLRASLGDYNLGLSEKLRRVLEALQVEMEYGRSVSSEEIKLDLDGRATQVSLFRLGRTALYYQTLDGSRAGAWDKAVAEWRPLDASHARTLRRAKDMAARKRAVELLELPVGGAQ